MSVIASRPFLVHRMPAPYRILVVEDVFVRSFLRTALERLGHTVVCASAADAVRHLKAGEVDLLVTNTPAAFGEFGEAVPLLFVAAFPDPALASTYRRWLPLRKPFQASELTIAVERLVEPR
jgi:hypothetical protein